MLPLSPLTFSDFSSPEDDGLQVESLPILNHRQVKDDGGERKTQSLDLPGLSIGPVIVTRTPSPTVPEYPSHPIEGHHPPLGIQENKEEAADGRLYPVLEDPVVSSSENEDFIKYSYFETILRDLRIENETLRSLIDSNNVAMKKQLKICREWQVSSISDGSPLFISLLFD